MHRTRNILFYIFEMIIILIIGWLYESLNSALDLFFSLPVSLADERNLYVELLDVAVSRTTDLVIISFEWIGKLRCGVRGHSFVWKSGGYLPTNQYVVECEICGLVKEKGKC
jgi:hypothetical protein